MKTEITDIRKAYNGYRIDFNRQDGATNTQALNVLVTVKELTDYVSSHELNLIEIPAENDVEQVSLDPETFVNENYATLIQKYLS